MDAFLDLNGKQIHDEDWYYSIDRGVIKNHRYAKNWHTDLRRLSTGRVLKSSGLTEAEALVIFQHNNIRNTVEP